MSDKYYIASCSCGKNLTVFDLGEKFKNGYKPKHIIRRKKYEQKRS